MEETLQHHGVKGMRWGVRKKRTSSSSGKSKKEKKLSKKDKKNAEKAHKSNEKKRSSSRSAAWRKVYENRGRMTDAELNRAVQRLRLENELNKMTKPPESYSSIIKNELKSQIAKEGSKLVVQAGSSYLKDSLKNRKKK